MAFTDEQITNYVYQLQQKNATPEDIEGFVKSAKQEQLQAAQQQQGDIQGQAAGAQPSSDQQSQQNNQNSGNWLDNAKSMLGTAATGAVRGAQNGGGIQGAIAGAAPGIGQALINNGATDQVNGTQMDPQVRAQLDQQHASDMNAHPQYSGEQIAQGGSFPQYTQQDFMNSPVGQFAQKEAPQLQEAMNQDATMSPGDRVGAVVGQAGTGFLNTLGGIADVGMGAASQLNPFDTRSPTEKTDQAMGGLNKIVSGVGGVLTSPLALSPVLQKGVSLPFEAAHDTLGTAIQQISGIDPTSNHGKTIIDSALNGLMLAAGANGEVMDAVKRGDLSLKGAWDTIKQTPDMAKAIPGQVVNAIGGIPDIGKDPEVVQATKQAAQQAAQQTNLERLARKAGVKDIDINAIRNLTSDQKDIASSYLDQGMKKFQDPVNTPSVWSLPAKEITDFLGKAKGQLRTVGQNMEDAINTDLAGKTVDATPVVDAFKDTMKKLNITKDTKGNLNFDGSDIAANSAAQSAIKTIQNNLTGNASITGSLNDAMQGTNLDARGLVSINRVLNDITGVTKKSGYNANALSAALSPIKDAVETTVAPHSSLYTQAKAEYADLKGNIDKVENAGKFGSGKNTGVSGEQILKRSLNTSDEKYSSAFDAMNKIGENYGIDAPTDLKTKAYLANMAEKISGTQAARSFAKQISENTANGLGKNILSKGVEKVPVVGPAAAQIIKGASDWTTDTNYQHFAGKIPGFKDAFAKASMGHMNAMMNLIKTPEFDELPIKAKSAILNNIAPSIPSDILSKIAKLSPIGAKKQVPIIDATDNGSSLSEDLSTDDDLTAGSTNY